MYAYRKMCPAQRAEVVAHRKLCQLPLHAPPHHPAGLRTYILTAATYAHAPIMTDAQRREDVERRFLAGFADQSEWQLFAWCVLPNHYHILARVNLDGYADWIGRLHNATSSRWNREDQAPGRKVWHRFADRAIRGERHYFATLNYIHANPVRHGWAKKANEWACSSACLYLEKHGRDDMIRLWQAYPVRHYGDGWDE